MTRRHQPGAGTSPFHSARAATVDREEKRAALLLAAVRMFNERGFHATSLTEVAASLGVTKPVIYHHLGNKDQVLFECVSHGLRELQEALRGTAGRTGTGLDRLCVFLQRYAEIIMGDFGRCVIRTGDELLSPPARQRFRALKREIDDALRAMIVAARDDGSAIVPDVRATAFTLAGALNWSARWYRANGEADAATMSAALVRSLIDGLQPHGEDR